MGFVLIIQLTTFDISLSPAGCCNSVYVVLMHQVQQKHLAALTSVLYCAVGDKCDASAATAMLLL
jgi:hypothetical protein